MRLRVAIDARRLQDEPLGGVGRSLTGVLDLVAREVDVVLLTDARRRPAPSSLPQVALRPLARAPETVWLQWNVRRWLRDFDGVFHGTFNALPFGTTVPSVVTLHDLSFETHPEGFSPSKRKVFQAQARHAARVATRIAVPSDFTRDELTKCYGVDPARIVVTRWGIEARFDPSRAMADVAVARARYGITGRYAVAMGGAPRRGLEVALGAWRFARAAGHDVALVVVGGEALPPEPGLIVAGRVDDETWAALLAGADAFCYPTRYEGFGVPALEAIASGTPVVCAPVASLPEILGDAAQWCAAPTVAAIGCGLTAVLSDPSRARELRYLAVERASNHPTWRDAAATLLSAYEETWREARPRGAAPPRARARSVPT